MTLLKKKNRIIWDQIKIYRLIMVIFSLTFSHPYGEFEFLYKKSRKVQQQYSPKFLLWRNRHESIWFTPDP